MSWTIPLFVALPMAGAFLVALTSRRSSSRAAFAGVLFTLLPAAGSFPALFLVRSESPIVYAVGGWAPPFGISMVLDGLSAFMLLTVNPLALLIVLFAVQYLDQFTGKWQFYCLFLLMLAGMNGVILTGDVFNLFVYLEVAAVASYALVAFGTEHHELEAAFKYAVMGTIGSLFVLLGIIWLYALTGTLNMADLAVRLQQGSNPQMGLMIAALFLAGLGLKAAIVPFHAWLPDAHPSAPAPISAMLSGVLIKSLGIYALCRILYTVLGITPAMSELLVTLGIISMLVGVILAVGQWDLKRLLAYHSISQVGYIVAALGIGTTLGFVAALFHLFNHSVFKSLLFLDSGSIEYAAGTRDLRKMGGLREKIPVTSSTTLAASMSIAGIPPFNGFWSKLLIILAAVEAGRYWLAFWAVAASILTLASFTKVLKYAFLGQMPERFKKVTEVPYLMQAATMVMALICLAGGLLILPELRELILDPAAQVLTNGVEAAEQMVAEVAQ